MLQPKAPLVDTSQAEGFNMSVLKRMDEDILEILYSATHVAVYEFDTSRKTWKRSDIEGTLFLVKRCSAPRFRMIVVNSKRIDNFMEEVDGSLECEVLQTFLLYTKGNHQLYGIWFYDEKNCEEFGQYLKRIVKGMPKSSPSGTPTVKKPTDLRNELQSIFNQLNGQSNGGTPQQQETDHLMRLFRQAHERSPPMSTPLAISTAVTSVPSELPNADVVLSLDATPPQPSLLSFGENSGLASVPLVPLPPDFFKPSSKASLPEEGQGLTLGADLSDESNGEGDPIASSLARFFDKNEQEGSITETVRNRFRQAIANLLSNDEILDVLIAEFRKVGIPIQ